MPAADVDRIGDHGHVVLEQISDKPPIAANQNDQRNMFCGTRWHRPVFEGKGLKASISL